MAALAKRGAKKDLRSQMTNRLSALSERDITLQSKTAQTTILKLPQYKQANRISIYLSMPTSEARTDILLRDALGAGKKVFVPYIHATATEKPKQKIMEMLRIENVDEYEALQRDSWGIPTLANEGRDERENAMGGQGLSFDTDGRVKDADLNEDVGGLDLVVVPAVAFDQNMNRLGHGAGFYDRYLTRFCQGKRKKPFLIGLCLGEQILPSGQLVVDEWDWKVDAVAVGDGQLLTLENTQ